MPMDLPGKEEDEARRKHPFESVNPKSLLDLHGH